MAGHPNEALMRQYGNQHIFEKKGDGASYLARMAYGAALAEHSRQAQELAAERHEHALRVSEALRDMRTARVLGLVEAAKHTRMPVILRAEPVPGADTDGGLSGIPGTAIPLGFDDGMVRIASAIGADLAQMEKDAGFAELPAAVSAVASKAKELFTGARAVGIGRVSAVKGALKPAVDVGRKVFNATPTAKLQTAYANPTAATALAKQAPKPVAPIKSPSGADKRLLEAERNLPSSAGQAPVAPAPTSDMFGQKIIDKAKGQLPGGGQQMSSPKAPNPLFGPEQPLTSSSPKLSPPQAAPVTPPSQPGAPAASPQAAPPPPPQPAASPPPGQLAPAQAPAQQPPAAQGAAPAPPAAAPAGPAGAPQAGAPPGQLAPAEPKAAVTGTSNPVTQHSDGTFHETLPGGGIKVHQTDPNAATITNTTQGDAAAAGKPGAIDRLKGMSGSEWASNLKRMAVMGGLAYGGYKLLNKGMDIMGQEPSAPATYGSNAPGLAYGVNQYGQPQY